MGCNDRIEEFLKSMKDKSKHEIQSLVSALNEDCELIKEIIDIIENNHASALSDVVCKSLFDIQSVGHQECSSFCIQFIPALVWALYSLISRKVKWNSSKVETLLLAIYNQVVQRNAESPFSNYFRVPTLSKSSIYHEPSTLDSTETENAVSHHEKSDRPILFKGASKHLDRIKAAYRSEVVKTALQEYNSNLSFCTLASLISYNNMVLRLCRCGYQYKSIDYKHISQPDLQMISDYPRVVLNSDVMKEMVATLQFLLYNGLAEIATTALKNLHQKGRHSLCTSGVLNTNALLNMINMKEKEFACLSPLDPYKSINRGRERVASPRNRNLSHATIDRSRLSPEPYTPLSPKSKPITLNVSIENRFNHAVEITETKIEVRQATPTEDHPMIDDIPMKPIQIDDIEFTSDNEINRDKVAVLNMLNNDNVKYINEDFDKNHDKIPLISTSDEIDSKNERAKPLDKEQCN